MDKCIHCGNTMTKQDMEEWHKESNKCCNGVDCGCRGMPTDPPECLPCIVKGLLEIAEKYKAKLTESEADNENLKRHGLRLQDCIDNRDKEIARLREALGKWECDITNAISDIRNDNMLDTEATLMEVLTEIEALKKGGE